MSLYRNLRDSFINLEFEVISKRRQQDLHLIAEKGYIFDRYESKHLKRNSSRGYITVKELP